MPDLTIKRNATWTLVVRRVKERTRFVLRSNDKRVYGDYSDLSLSDKEWDRLVAWMEFQRASEGIKEV
jgi:hypothetical protein